MTTPESPLPIGQRLRQPARLYGTLIVSPSPHWVPVVAALGLDFVFIDTEHIPIDRSAYNNGSVIELDPSLRHLVDGSHHDLNRKKVDTDLRNDSYKTNGLNRCEYSIASMEHKKELHCYHYLANL